MKTFLIKLFAVCLFSCAEKTLASAVNNTSSQYIFSLPNRDTTQIKLSGKYILKFTNTSKDRKWVKATSVGLSFFPDTYLYSTGTFSFDTVTQKVSLSSISVIPSLPSSGYGSYPYNISGNSLTIKYNNKKNYAQLKIIAIEKNKLVVEDIRTKIQWMFYKA
jgi:hypothetical protein